MSLRVYVEAKLLISQDNALNPQEPTFSSGSKSSTNTSDYNESASHTFDVPVAAVDAQVNFGSLSSAELIYIMAKGPGLLIKLVPVGQLLADTLAYEIIENVPAIIPFKVAAAYVSNPTATAQKLILGAAGN